MEYCLQNKNDFCVSFLCRKLKPNAIHLQAGSISPYKKLICFVSTERETFVNEMENRIFQLELE